MFKNDINTYIEYPISYRLNYQVSRKLANGEHALHTCLSACAVVFFFEDKVASLISKDDYNPAQAVLVHRLGIHDATPQTSPY